MGATLEQQFTDAGYAKVPNAKNLWVRHEDDADTYHYLRQGKMVPAAGLTPEDARTYEVDLAKIPEGLRPKRPTLENYSAKIANLNQLTGKAYEEARGIVERTDDALIEAEFRGEVLQHFVYRFESGGRSIVGLTYVGIKELAKRVGRIKVDKVDIQDKPDSYIVVCLGENLESGVSMPGVAEQAKWLTRKNGQRELDPFALQKATSKAIRNCLKNLVPEVQALVLLKKWLEEAESEKNAGRRN